jgi:hypothetical protein
MRQIILIIIIGFCFTSCDFQTKHNSDIQWKEFNKAVDMLLKSKFDDVVIIRTETNPIFSTNPSKPITISNTVLIPPPPPEMIIYSKEFFNSLVNENKLNSDDAVFMASHIDSTIIIDLEIKNNFNRLIARDKLNKIVGNDSVAIADNYDTNSYLEISSPLFNEDMSKLIISVDFYCGDLCGGGDLFILTKINGEWKILETICRWMS